MHLLQRCASPKEGDCVSVSSGGAGKDAVAGLKEKGKLQWNRSDGTIATSFGLLEKNRADLKVPVLLAKMDRVLRFGWASADVG